MNNKKFNPKFNKNYKGKNNKAQNDVSYSPPSQEVPLYELFISNYPKDKNVDAILNLLYMDIEQKYGAKPKILMKMETLDGVMLQVQNQVQFKAFLSCNGDLISNQHIWIVTFPRFIGKYTEAFNIIFHNCLCNGQMDLSNLADTFSRLGLNPQVVNFNNRQFVEFLFFRLGTEARDNRYYIGSLLLNNNNIITIKPYSPFFIFLPELRHICLNGNCLKSQPILPRWPCIEVECDPSTQVEFQGNSQVASTNYNKNDSNTWDYPQTENIYDDFDE